MNTRVIVIGAVLAHPGVTIADDPVFNGVAEFGAGATVPVAWGDFDGDGDFDLAVGNFFNQPNELYVNDGSGNFTQRDEFGTGNTFAIAWADVDNDGDLDMSVGNDGTNQLHINNGDGTFSGQSQFGASRTVALAWGDANGDGWLDLAIGNGILGVAQQNLLYVNDQDGSFSVQAQFGSDQTGSVAWADADDDGDLDLAVGNGGFGSAGPNAVYMNDGAGNFRAVPLEGLADTAAVAWADVDNDGLFDLAIANWNDGQNVLLANQGNMQFVSGAAFGARDTNTIAWGDFDLDGDQDLAVGNGDFMSAAQNFLYENDGSGVFTEHAVFGVGSTDGMAWADADGDGDLDLAVGNEHSPTQNELWSNLQLGGQAVVLNLAGQFHAHGDGYSNRSAVGAKVTLYDAGHLGDPAHRIGCQQVESKGGFSSQNPLQLTFGVSGAVDVHIDWPGSSGVSFVQDVRSVDAGVHLVVETRPGDTNEDGVVDVDDLVAVILGWGPCPDPPSECPADLDQSGAVDVEDLLEVILNWS